MKPEPERIRELFVAAVGRVDPARWDGFLEEASAGDEALIREVRLLLKAHHDAGSFLDAPAPAPTITRESPRLAEGPGTVIGPYKLLELVGEGGMGTVYMAEQTHPVRRKVALKVIKPGMDTKQVIARFEAERQALALMDHPNIARVLDAGATESGRPYFVMELVKGVPITDYCDREHLPIPERLGLFVLVCRAVQHAHQKGIIHRDLKPSNVMVTVIDGAAVPKVIDFGVAKATGGRLTERTLFTGLHQFIGTPMYMSPEQADLSGVDVDTRSDVYALGVLLYELLTGATPFDQEVLRKAALDEVRRIIREEEPPKPSTRISSLGPTLATVSGNRGADPRRLALVVRGDLDWVVMKALEKDRRRRYQTADAFAADVLRYQADQPVEACPPSLNYHVRKFARRNRAALATSALVLLAMAAGTAVSVWQAVRATDAERRTVTALATARTQSALAEARRKTADEQRRLADQQFALARKAVDEMYTEAVEKWLSRQNKPSPIQQEFLGKALNFYVQFARAPGRDPEARHQALHASARVGEIQRTLDHLDEAERAYRQSLALARELVREVPAKPEYRRDEAEAHLDHGSVLLELGQVGEAEPALRQGLRLQEALTAEAPTANHQQTLVRLLTGLGHLLEHTRRPAEAEALYRRGLAILGELAPKQADDPLYRRTLTGNLSALGRLLRESGRAREAGPHFERCVDLFRPVLAARPNDPDLRLEMARLLTNWGLALWADGRLEEAEAINRRAAEQVEALAADYPAMPGYRVGLADALADLADLLEDRGQPDEADRTFDRARTVLRKLIADSPDPSPYRTKVSSLETRRKLSKGVMRGLHAFERFVGKVDPLFRSQPMWTVIPPLSRLAARRPRAVSVRRLALSPLGLEVLDDRTLMTGGWAAALGTSGTTNAGGVALDPGHAAVYVVGSELARYTTGGQLLWARDLGGQSNQGVAVDSAGDAYVSGQFSGTLVLGSQSLTSAGDTDAFVAKFDPSGNVLWARSFGGPGADQGWGLAVDATGAAYVTGRFSGTVAFDATHTLTSAGDVDIFVLKLDPSGGVAYATQAGGTGHDTGIRVAVDGSGRAYASGYFAGTASFGATSLTSPGAYSGFVAQLDANGAFTWVRQMGCPAATDQSYAQVQGVAVDPAGHVYATGVFIGTATFGDSGDGAGATTLTAFGLKDGFVTSLDAATGRFLWTEQIGGPSASVTAQGLALDSAGNLYTTGIFLGQNRCIDSDPGPGSALLSPSNSVWSSYVTEFSPTGRFLATWEAAAGVNAYASTPGVAVGADGSVYTAGTFSLNVTLDTGTRYVTLTSSQRDGFVSRMTPGQSVLFGQVFSDANRNGVNDAGESPLAGVTVYVDANHNGKLDRGELSTTTNPQGGFNFYHLAAGTYTLREVVPSGYTLTTPPAVNVTLAAGQFNDSTAFGNYKPSLGSANVGKNARVTTGTQTPDALSALAIADPPSIQDMNARLKVTNSGQQPFTIPLAPAGDQDLTLLANELIRSGTKRPRQLLETKAATRTF